MHPAPNTRALCLRCGEAKATHETLSSSAAPCQVCGYSPRAGPDLLTLVTVFAEDQILLIRRGTEPYLGKWAPPGGYAEYGESVEAAAARELWEETGLVLDPNAFHVTGVLSVTAMNQVHILLTAILERAEPVRGIAPEALDARWFTLETFPRDEVWDPLLTVGIEDLFSTCAERRFHFVHQTDKARRVVLTNAGFLQPWRRAD